MKSALTRIVIQPTGDMVILDRWGELAGGSKAPSTILGRNKKIASDRTLLPVTHVGLHYGEELFLSAGRPTVAVYFARCNLACVDCTQDLSLPTTNLSSQELLRTILTYIEKGGAAVNFVSPTRYYRKLLLVFEALFRANPRVPLIYNCGGYESESSIAAVAPWTDIFLPDFKAISSDVLKERRLPQSYADQLMRVLPLMTKERPIVFDGGQLLRGTVIRHLLLPGRPTEFLEVLEALEPFADRIVVNAMTHYYLPAEHRIVDVKLPDLPVSLRSRFRLYVDGKECVSHG